MTPALATVAALFRPLGTVNLPVLGDRAPWTHGPAMVLREYGLLPPLHTLLGALAAKYWALRGGGGCSDWWSCVAAPAARLLCGSGADPRGVRVYGPFLVTARGVYIDATTALLRVHGGDGDCLDRYLEAASLIQEAAAALLPARRARLRRQAAEKLQGCIAEAERVAWVAEHVGLQPLSKTAAHGLLYSMAKADYYALAEGTPAVAVTATCPGQASDGEHLGLARVGPRGSIHVLAIHRLTAEPQGGGSQAPLVVTSPAPMNPGASACEQAIHPLGAKTTTIIVKSYSISASSGYTKHLPAPAYTPGTVLPTGGHSLVDTLAPAQPATTPETIKTHAQLLHRLHAETAPEEHTATP